MGIDVTRFAARSMLVVAVVASFAPGCTKEQAGVVVVPAAASALAEVSVATTRPGAEVSRRLLEARGSWDIDAFTAAAGGEIFVLGRFDGAVDLGAGRMIAARFGAAFVARYDAGATRARMSRAFPDLWRSDVGPGGAVMTIEDEEGPPRLLRVGADGEDVFTTELPKEPFVERVFLDPHGATYAFSRIQGAPRVLRIDGSGHFGGATMLAPPRDVAGFAVDGAGRAYALSEKQDGAVMDCSDTERRIGETELAVYEAGGKMGWSRSLGVGLSPNDPPLPGSDGSTVVLVSLGSPAERWATPERCSESVLRVIKFDPRGERLWERDLRSKDFGQQRYLARDARGDIIVAGRLEGGLTAGAFTLAPAGNASFVMKLDAASGAVAWATKASGDVRALAIDDERHVWATLLMNGGTSADDTESARERETSAYAIVRLAP